VATKAQAAAPEIIIPEPEKAPVMEEDYGHFRDHCAALFVSRMIDPRAVKGFPDDGHSNLNAASTLMIRSAVYLADRLVATLHPKEEA